MCCLYFDGLRNGGLVTQFGLNLLEATVEFSTSDRIVYLAFDIEGEVIVDVFESRVKGFQFSESPPRIDFDINSDVVSSTPRLSNLVINGLKGVL